MKTAAIVIDSWKLPTFKKVLDGAGFTYTQHEGITKGTKLLKVNYQWVADLKPVVERANNECAKLKSN